MVSEGLEWVLGMETQETPVHSLEFFFYPCNIFKTLTTVVEVLWPCSFPVFIETCKDLIRQLSIFCLSIEQDRCTLCSFEMSLFERWDSILKETPKLHVTSWTVRQSNQSPYRYPQTYSNAKDIIILTKIYRFSADELKDLFYDKVNHS